MYRKHALGRKPISQPHEIDQHVPDPQLCHIAFKVFCVQTVHCVRLSFCLQLLEVSRANTTEHLLLLALPSPPDSPLYWFGTGMFRSAGADAFLMEQHILACNFFAQFWSFPDAVRITPVSDGKLHKWSRPTQKAGYVLPIAEQNVRRL